MDIINELVESVAPNPVKQLDEAGLAKAATDLAKKAAPAIALAAPIYMALRKKKRIAASAGQVMDYAKQLVKAKTKQQAVVAVAGLLHVGAQVFLSVPELRDLGHKLNSVVLSQTLMEYLS
jgi:hypothetical protein